MEGEKQEVTPEAGMTTPEPTQPSIGPAAPEGMTGQDDQTRTTDDAVKADKEQAYQTKYQELVGALKEAGIDIEMLKSGDSAGLIDNAFPSQQSPGQQPSPELTPEQQAAEEQGFDPYDPQSMKAYFDHNFGLIRGNLSNTVRDVVKEVRMEEQLRAEWESCRTDFNKWAAENKVPQEAINQAVQKYHVNFGMAGTPAAFIDTVKWYIGQSGAATAETGQRDAKIAEAIKKAKELAAVEQPAPGASPSPQSPKEKTWQEKEADTIAPDSEYVYPGN